MQYTKSALEQARCDAPPIAVQNALPYGLGDLAPVFSENQMTLHFTKHAAAYTSKLNSLLEEACVAKNRG